MSFVRKLPWPCSRVERDVLHALWVEARRTGRPITQIIKEAVDSHLAVLDREAAGPALPDPPQPAPAITISTPVGHAA